MGVFLASLLAALFARTSFITDKRLSNFSLDICRLIFHKSNYNESIECAKVFCTTSDIFIACETTFCEEVVTCNLGCG